MTKSNAFGCSRLTFRQISELANCSQGTVALEIKEWEAEKAAGIERNLDDEIDKELSDKPQEKNFEGTAPAPLPVEVVRFYKNYLSNSLSSVLLSYQKNTMASD